MIFKNRVRKNPKYQKLLQNGFRIKELLKDAPSTQTEYVHLFTEGVVEYCFIQTGNRSTKKQAAINPRMLEFVAYCDAYGEAIGLHREIDEYISLNASQKIQERDVLGKKIARKILGQSYEELLKLVHKDIVDFIFDCIDYDDDRKERYAIHFTYSDCMRVREEFSNAEDVLSLLAEDINQDNYKVLQQHTSSSSTATTLIYLKTLDKKAYYQCSCGTTFRIPADKKHIIATCPKCKKRWEIRQ